MLTRIRVTRIPYTRRRSSIHYSVSLSEDQLCLRYNPPTCPRYVHYIFLCASLVAHSFSQIGEVARVVHFLRKHAVGRSIRNVLVQDDPIVYGKVGTSADAFQSAMKGRKIVGAKQQGKYFWLEMDQPPNPLLHLGMTGWIFFSNDKTTGYYKPKNEEEDWPPKFWKFVLELEGADDVKVAFADGRRLGRVRLVDAKAEDMRKTPPLNANGPDPIVDSKVLTVDWLAKKMRSKKVPIKALLLDQGNISGVGNWVADEVLFQARIHPEQYSNTFSDEQIKMLHDKLMEVCTIACDTLAESDKFPDNWLMKHRWKKGKKESSTLPTGEKIIHLTVGGRTSAVVPSLQKKTGAVAGDVSTSDVLGDGEDEENEKALAKPKKGQAKQASTPKKEIKSNGVGVRPIKREADEEEEAGTASNKRAKGVNSAKSTPKKNVATEEPTNTGRRRSGRLSRG